MYEAACIAEMERKAEHVFGISGEVLCIDQRTRNSMLSSEYLDTDSDIQA